MPIIGQYVQRLSGATQYSPPFPRGGQKALITAEAFSIPAGSSLSILVEQKNEEDTTWSSVGGLNLVTTGMTSVVIGLPIMGLKEMLRLGYVHLGGLSPQPYDTIYFNVPPPTWIP